MSSNESYWCWLIMKNLFYLRMINSKRFLTVSGELSSIKWFHTEQINSHIQIGLNIEYCRLETSSLETYFSKDLWYNLLVRLRTYGISTLYLHTLFVFALFYGGCQVTWEHMEILAHSDIVNYICRCELQWVCFLWSSFIHQVSDIFFWF